MLWRNLQRSWTCGSAAARRNSVFPGVMEASITAFSVPVTLISGKMMVFPLSSFILRCNDWVSSIISTPSSRNACVCAATDLLPSTHPPGNGRFTSLFRAKSGPKSRIDALILHIKSEGSSFSESFEASI